MESSVGSNDSVEKIAEYLGCHLQHLGSITWADVLIQGNIDSKQILSHVPPPRFLSTGELGLPS